MIVHSRFAIRVRWTVTLAVVAIAAGACASGPAPGPDTSTSVVVDPFEQDRRRGVEQLLQRWGDAVRTGDTDALADLVDPSASPDFLQAEIRRAGNLSEVPLSDWGYEIVDEPETPVPSAVASPLDAADVWAPSVVLRYAIQGADSEPTRREVSLLLAERDDRWRIVSDTEIPGIDRRTWRGPWDFGPVTSASVPTAGGTSVILGHPDRAASIAALAAELPSAVDAVTDFYGSDWARTAVVFTSSSPEEFAAAVGTDTAARDVAAVTVSDAVIPERPLSGQRIVFGPSAQDRLTEFTTRSVLRHELTHVAARRETVDGSPIWLLEGFADYSGYRGTGADFRRLAPTLSALVATGGAPTVLPEDSDFVAGGARSTLAYEAAWSVCAFVADTSGESALRALYGRLATGPADATELDDALTEVTGSGTAQFTAAWGAWVLERSR